MNYKSLAGNAFVAFAAQGISLVASVAMSLIVPKVLGVTTYGYWQLFVFYTSYSGMFQFGLNDGVYLIEGGRARREIDKRAINSQFLVGIVIQVCVGLAAVLSASIAAPEQERAIVLIAFGVYTIIFNLQGYLGFLFQAMNETKLFSFASIIERVLFLVALLVLVAHKVDSFVPYIILYTIAKLISLGYCAWNARDILTSGFLSLHQSFGLALKSVKVGIGLMIANVASMFILGVMRFFIDAAWGIEVFGRVSFSLSMVNFFITFVSQASMVLFPALRQGTKAERRSFYLGIRDLMEICLPAIYLLYFPMVAILSIWLPQYSTSMIYFAFLLPVCVFDTKMDVCCTTYFKVLRKERVLLAVNIVTCVCSTVASLLGVYCLNSLEAVLVGVVICIIGRSLWSEYYLNRHLDVNGTPIALEEIVLTIVFIGLVSCFSFVIAICVYFVFYVAYLTFNRDAVRALTKRLKRVLGIRL